MVEVFVLSAKREQQNFCRANSRYLQLLIDKVFVVVSPNKTKLLTPSTFMRCDLMEKFRQWHLPAAAQIVSLQQVCEANKADTLCLSGPCMVKPSWGLLSPGQTQTHPSQSVSPHKSFTFVVQVCTYSNKFRGKSAERFMVVCQWVHGADGDRWGEVSKIRNEKNT